MRSAILLATAMIISPAAAQQQPQQTLGEGLLVILDETPTVVTAATTPATAANGEVGTCGGGDRGNGVCANGKCCSKWGRCGITPEHCDGSTFPPTTSPISTPITPKPTPKPISLVAIPAVAATTTTVATAAASSNNNQAVSTLATTANGEVGTCGGGNIGNGVCANGKCCSEWGRCGITPAHCGTSPPTASPIIQPTGPPTSTPTVRDWSGLTPGWKKYCGPAVVGGYEIAKVTCSPLLECGRKTEDTHFGSTGNDCPDGLMCFGDIDCNPPTSMPSSMPSMNPSDSSMPTVVSSGAPSGLPSVSFSPTMEGQTKAPTYKPTTPVPTYYPTVQTAPTVKPDNVQNSITKRGSFCGASYQAAVNRCSPDTSCESDDDCENGGECYINVSCTYHATEDEEYYSGKDTGAPDSSSSDEDGLNFGEEYDPEDSSCPTARTFMVATVVVLVGAFLI